MESHEEQLEVRLRELMALLRTRQNGEVVAQLRESGLRYPVMLGVPLVELRVLARAHGADHPLARRLAEGKSREMLLLASMLGDPMSFDPEGDRARWESVLGYHETSDVAASELWSRLPAPYPLEWLESSDLTERRAGAMTLGHLIRRGRLGRVDGRRMALAEGDKEYPLPTPERIVAMAEEEGGMAPWGFVLARLAQHHKEERLLHDIIALLRAAKAEEHPLLAELLGRVEAELALL